MVNIVPFILLVSIAYIAPPLKAVLLLKFEFLQITCEAKIAPPSSAWLFMKLQFATVELCCGYVSLSLFISLLMAIAPPLVALFLMKLQLNVMFSYSSKKLSAPPLCAVFAMKLPLNVMLYAVVL